MDAGKNIWGDLNLVSGETEFIAIGNLRIWILFKDVDIWVGYTHVKSEEEIGSENPDPPEDLDWARWAIKNEVKNVRILPVFPDKPLVVKSEYSLKISPAAEVYIFARIPIWIKIFIPDNHYQLIEISTVNLSRTWFGTPLEGELCYHATTKARRSLSGVSPRPYLVNCPILISNKSDEVLDFENFCYRVGRLSIFQHKNELWAEETRIIYRGESLNSDVVMTGKLPKGIEKKKMLSGPRREVSKSFATRTFRKFFEDTDYLGR